MLRILLRIRREILRIALQNFAKLASLPRKMVESQEKIARRGMALRVPEWGRSLTLW